MKKCIICEEEEASYCIKGMPNQCYCTECAQEQFADLDTLEKLEPAPEVASKAIDELSLSDSDSDTEEDEDSKEEE